MSRVVSAFVSLILIALSATPSLARNDDQVRMQLELIAALEAYRDTGVPLATDEYAPPAMDEQSAFWRDDFTPPAGGHSLRTTYAGHERSEAKYEERPNGARAWIYEANRKQWGKMFRLVKAQVEEAIRARYEARDDLFYDYYTIRSYDELRAAAKKAERDLGTLSRRQQAYVDEAKARRLALIAKDAAPRGSFAGAWKTSWGAGGAPMTLSLSGRRVSGSYKHKGGTVTGTLSADGRTLNGTWSHSKGRGKGKFRFVLSKDGRSFTGTYGYGEKLGSSRWNGKRN